MPTEPDSATDGIDATIVDDAATVLDDEKSSCPPTELDSDNDDANAAIVVDDVVAVVNNATMPGDANAAIIVDDDDAAIVDNVSVVLSSGDKQEKNRCNYNITKKLKLGSVPYLKMALTPFGGDDNDHSVRYVQKMLERGYVNGFKIGATHLPVQRWKRYKKEFMHRWREMVIVAVTESLDEIKRLETSVISAFRKYNAFGICINPVSGHPLCLNRLPGGESLNHGHSPFFLYIVRK